MKFLPDKHVAIVTVLCMVIGYSAGHLAVMSIDLGSEFIKIAIVKPGIPMEVITNEDSARKTASIVAIRNGERLFGNPAESSATKDPSTAFWYLTQIVGKKFEDPAVAQYQKRFPFYKLVKDETRGTVLFQVDEETQHSPEELLAMLLEKCRQFAETFADQTIKDTVITVPSYFNQAERRAMLMAAEMSGLNVLQMLGDNAAVALNYGVFRRKQFNTSMTYIMFYDMGATSTTATIVGYQVVKMKEGTRVVENPQLVIKGVGFDRNLGGLEISMRLRDHLAQHFHKTKKTKLDVYTNYRAMAKLLKEAKRVKKVLSANMEHKAQIEGLLDDEDFKLKVTRAELEEMNADLFARVTKPIEDALAASEITTLEVSDVILMGGGTRIPKVQQLLQTYLGRTELGKSINTDEAAALGAVYQAAHLGKGFKVLPFGVKEATVYPIIVEFEKHRNEESHEPPKVIKRTLFGRMNPYPQKKVMTFNKHFTDFSFNVSYGDLDFMPEDEAKIFRALQGRIHNVELKGVAEAYAKHTDAEESKGIKVHFKMDENGILKLDMVETVFEKEDTTVKDESMFSKLGDTISGLFGSTDDVKIDLEGAGKSEENKTESQSGSEPVDDAGKEEPVKEDTDQSRETTENNEGEDTASKDEQKDEQTEDGEEDGEKVPEKTEEQAEQAEESADNGNDEKDKLEDKKESEKEDSKKGEDKKDKSGKKKDKEEKKESEGDKKPKIVVVRENITVDSLITDIPLPSKDSLKASKKKLADLTAKDKEKKLLGQAKNELEAYIYTMGDKLTQELYERCSTEEEREEYNKMLAEASDWLYEQDEDTKKEPFIEKLKDMKKALKKLEFRVVELKERPEALAALTQMLNQSSFFLMSIKNLTALESEEDSIFTKVEIDTLEKLINETEEWKETIIEEQSKVPDYKKPKLLLEDVGSKMQALDREVKYLLNKAKTYKPKSKPKVAKNKTVDKNETVIDTEKEEEQPTKTDDTTADSEETASPKPDVESEIPSPPTEEETEKEDDTLLLGDGDEETETTTTKPTEKPVEANTHNPDDL